VLFEDGLLTKGFAGVPTTSAAKISRSISCISQREIAILYPSVLGAFLIKIGAFAVGGDAFYGAVRGLLSPIPTALATLL